MVEVHTMNVNIISLYLFILDFPCEMKVTAFFFHSNALIMELNKEEWLCLLKSYPEKSSMKDWKTGECENLI